MARYLVLAAFVDDSKLEFTAPYALETVVDTSTRDEAAQLARSFALQHAREKLGWDFFGDRVHLPFDEAVELVYSAGLYVGDPRVVLLSDVACLAPYTPDGMSVRRNT